MSLDKHKGRKRPFLTPLFFALALSLFAHAVFLFVQYRDALLNEAAEPQSEPIEITEVPKEAAPPVSPNASGQKKKKLPPPDEKKMQLAETEDAKNRELDPKARFLGEHNQKAEKQSRSKMIDDFRKKQGTGLKNENKQATNLPPPTLGEGGQGANLPVPGEGEAGQTQQPGAPGIKRDWKTLSLKDLSVGGDGGATGATDDKLDGVSEGDRTILSTREYKFFSYYQRIKELLRQYWKPNVERKLAKLYHTGKTVQEDELVTKILVMLDDKGSIQKISRVSGSGIDEVDQAAVEAFQKAAPFPNPPRGIIDADGFVRIRWDFILTVEAAPRIQFQTAGERPMY